jgi:hypothetical protein
MVYNDREGTHRNVDAAKACKNRASITPAIQGFFDIEMIQTPLQKQQAGSDQNRPG